MPSPSLKKILFWILSVTLTCLLLYFCFRKLNFPTFFDHLRQVNGIYLGLGFVLSFSIVVWNTIQLRLFLPQTSLVPFPKMFQIVSIFSMMVNLVPFWGGHLLFVYLLGHRERVGKTVAVSVMTLDQIAEGFAKIFLFGLVSLLAPLPSSMKQGMQGVLLLVFVAYLILFILAVRYRDFDQNQHLFDQAGWKRIFHFFKNWAYHLHALRSVQKTLITFVLAMGMKCIEVFAVFCVQKSFGLNLPLSSAFLVVAALSLATTLPLTPGRLGLFEGAALLVYEYLGVEKNTAMLLGIFIHIVHTLPFIMAGYLMMLKMGFHRKEIKGMD